MLAIKLLEESGTTGPDISWLIWVVLGAFLCMVFLGWWASKRLPVEEAPSQAQLEHGHGDHP